MKSTTTLPVIVSTREVLHRNAFQSGPRISEVQTIRMPDGSLVEVSIWKNAAGKVCQVGAPVTVALAEHDVATALADKSFAAREAAFQSWDHACNARNRISSV